MIILLFIGLIIIVGGCFYSRKVHKKVFVDGILPGSDNLPGIILLFVLIGLNFSPWYITKSVIILTGVLIIFWTLKCQLA
ncbi:hypothetical protein [Priestia megaterium]|uniref:hypothetical protein n=1 Tax=Priestia megaterium TaxID=1404 RepID=UPI0025AFC1FB|nr:hypothetical protein [Priestia megaterium]MDN3233450.1 hypothetical protein [Priestia megaterium]